MAKTALVNGIYVAALGVVAITLMGCQSYEVKMSYKCVNPVGNVCMEWVQNGAVQQPTTCFPADALVTTRTGPKAMSELHIGEEILGFDHTTGKPEFTAVRAWLHRDVQSETKMTSVKTSSGTVVASPRHLLAVNGGSAYAFAADLKPGNTLVAPDGSRAVVKSVSETRGQGLYAPLTWTSNYFVSGPSVSMTQSSVLAHNFAEFRNPRQYEAVWHTLLSVAEFFSPSIHAIESKDEAYIHPVASFFMKLMGFAPPPVHHTRANAPRVFEPASAVSATIV